MWWWLWALWIGLAGASDPPATHQEAAEARERPTGQTHSDDLLVDHDLSFSLERLDPTWLVLAETQARSMIPDAVGVIAVPGGTWLGVIPEQAGTATLDGMHQLLIGAVDPRTATLHVEERGTFLGHPAWHTVITGMEHESAYKQERWTILVQGWLYQVVASTAAGDEQTALAKDLTGLFPAFRLRDDPPRSRPLAPLEDMANRQWEVRDGAYADATFGLGWDPGGDWRLAVGLELAQMNESARVGVMRTDPEVYVAVVPERVGDRDAGAVITYLYDAFWTDFAITEPLPAMPLKVAGQLVDFVGGPLPGDLPGQAWHGVLHTRDLALQVQFWFAGAVDPDASVAAAAEVIERLQVFDQETLDGVATRLAEQPWSTELGRDWRWRSGTLHDYAAQVAWSAETQHWVVLGGEAATLDQGSEAVFVVQDPSRAFIGVVREVTGPADLEQALQARLDQDFGEDTGARLKKTKVGGQRGLGATVTTSDGLLSFTWRYAMVSRGDGSTLLVEGWSLTSVADLAREAFDELTGGLIHDTPLQDTRFDSQGFHSDRLGFRQATLPGQRCEDQTPPQLVARGVMLVCSDAKGHAALALGVHGVPDGADPDERLGLVEMVLGEQALTRFGRTWQAEEAVLAGVPATRVVLDPPGPHVEVTVAVAGQIVLLSMSIGQGEAQAEHWRAGMSVTP